VVVRLSGQDKPDGLPFIRNFEPKEYGLNPQNWEVTSDSSGRIYIANDEGLLIYDGRSWIRFIEELNYSANVVRNINDRIYIAGEEYLGYVSSDSLGRLSFHSIIDNIPDSLWGFGFIEDFEISDSQICFTTEHDIFLLHNGKVQNFYFEQKIREQFYVNGEHFFWVEEKGLVKLDSDGLSNAFQNNSLSDHRIVEMFSLNGKSHVLVNQLGICHIDAQGELKVREIPLNEIFKGATITSALITPTGNLIVCLEDLGIYISTDFETVDLHLNNDLGLQDEAVEGFHLDDFGNLWLATNNGVTSVNLEYPFRVFDERLSLEGMVLDIAEFDDEIYSATRAGVYVMQHEFAKEVLPLQSWALQPFHFVGQNGLLVATNNDISILDRDWNLTTLVECYPWEVAQSSRNKTEFYVGLDPGVLFIKWNGDDWVVSQEITDIPAPINNFSEGERLWIGSRDEWHYSSDFPVWYDDSVSLENVQLYDSSRHPLKAGPVYTQEFKGEQYVGSVEGLFKWESGTYVLMDSLISDFPRKSLVHRLLNDSEKRLWAFLLKPDNSFELGYIKDGSWVSELFNPIAKDIVYDMFFEKNGEVWLGGAGGLFHYVPDSTFDHRKPFNCFLTRVSVLQDSLIHGGFWSDENSVFTNLQPDWAIPSFHYKTNEISFSFASSSYGDEEDVYYSYELEGYDQGWSNWTQQTKKEYTNLPPRNYVFKVKAKNVFETESRISEYRFAIEKPWYETASYYIALSLGLLTLVLITILSNRSGKPTVFSSIIAFVTIITVFEFIIMMIEPIVEQYTDEIPIFNLMMNVLMAASLYPVEQLIRRFLNKRKDD
jgi:ligand-binding sensor domain-containing protein